MVYTGFPPEINSGRMYTGPGAGPLLAAARAWDGLAAELRTTVAAYTSTIEALIAGPWLGPSSATMAAAVAPYLVWMQSTAAQAAETSAQAAAAADAYEAAFIGHVPPSAIATNRAELAMLVATNLVGQNTAMIAALETQYHQMWVQDAVAMSDYAAASAAATVLQPFTAAPQITDHQGTAAQAAATSAALAAAANNSVTEFESALEVGSGGLIRQLLSLGADVAHAYTEAVTGLLDGILGPFGSQWFELAYLALRLPSGLALQANAIGLLVNFPLGQAVKFGPLLAAPAAAGAELGAEAGLGVAGIPGATLLSSVTPTAELGRATLVGSVRVPPSWAIATPAVRTVAAALSAAGGDAVTAAALGEGSLFSSMALAGMLGSAAGAGAPTIVRSGMAGKATPVRELKDATSPENLTRLVAQIAEAPESVQHHHVDQDGLDALLEQLAKKPGIHAVHLTKGAQRPLTAPEFPA